MPLDARHRQHERPIGLFGSGTTHGIWLAKSPKLAASRNAPLTLVMDLEGSDGRERGEGDTSFERPSALFALATSDVLMINMWAKVRPLTRDSKDGSIDRSVHHALT